MVLEATQSAVLPEYLTSFGPLIGDRRTWVTLQEIVKGIINGGSLVCQRIAGASAKLSAAKDGGQRVSRLATGESTKRSEIDAETLTAALRQRGIEHLGRQVQTSYGPLRTCQTCASRMRERCQP